jgi:hypothetical protein
MFDPYLEWLQIPAHRRPPNHYDLLGLSDFESDGQRIQQAALTRAGQVRRYQLGRHADDALRLIGELSTAFDCLSTPDRKRQYDDTLRAAVAVPSAPTLLDPTETLHDAVVETPTIEIRPLAPLTSSRRRSPGRRRPAIWLLGGASVAIVALLLMVLAREPVAPRPGGKVPARTTVIVPRQPSRSEPPQPEASATATWKIVRARYGARARWAETTDIVLQAIRNDRLNLPVNNTTMRGDPAYGHIKTLVIELQRGQQTETLRFGEGRRAVLDLTATNLPRP